METLRQRNRLAVKKYYDTHSSSVIKQKTLYYLTKKGRIPTPLTLEKHGIDPELVKQKLNEFALQHPTSNATSKALNKGVFSYYFILMQ